MMTEEEFWSATDELKLIHQWARASYVGPWPLLFAVLLRVIVSTGYRVMLPGPPAPASLNLGIVLIGRSGAGKGVTDKLSRIVWPDNGIHEEGLGSGQGIAELFKEPKNKDERVTSALFTVSEVDHLAALAAGRENNTLAALKAALTGDRLGSRGASAATTRSVPADSYRLGLSISAQLGHTAVLLDDVSGGTPQRLLWAPVADSSIPDTPGPQPDRTLDVKLPPWASADKTTLLTYGTPEIAQYVNAGLLANARGELDAIDGHRTLTRLKVAAALAIMRHHSVIGGLDWRLSGVIMATSDRTRAEVIEYDRRAARESNRKRALTKAEFEETIDGRRTEVVKRRIVSALTKYGRMSSGKLRAALGKRDYRELFESAIGDLVNGGSVLHVPSDRASFYELTEFNLEPEFNPQNSSSDGLNQSSRLNYSVPHDQYATRQNGTESVVADGASTPDKSLSETEDQPVNKSETAPKITRPTRCSKCNMDLPKAASGDLCDDCNDSVGTRAIAAEIRRGDDWRIPDSQRVSDARVEQDLAMRRAQRQVLKSMYVDGEPA